MMCEWMKEKLYMNKNAEISQSTFYYNKNKKASDLIIYSTSIYKKNILENDLTWFVKMGFYHLQ